MSVAFLFEDSENAPSSVLLRSSGFGSHMYFSGGNNFLYDYCIELLSKYSTIYCFIDVPPNRQRCIFVYKNLVMRLNNKNLLNTRIFVIPIICIEYYLCKFLKENGYLNVKRKEISLLVENLVGTFNYGEVREIIDSKDYLSVSLEHVYKYIISNQGVPCLKNSFEYTGINSKERKHSLSGIFYDRDCTCDKKYCRVGSSALLKVKAEQFYTTLPVCEIDTDAYRIYLEEVMGIHMVDMSYEELKHRLEVEYKNICHQMGINSIKFE